MGSLSASARDSGFNTTTPAPSLRTNPLADASNALHLQSGESIESRLKPMNGSGLMRMLTPPASATGDVLWTTRRQLAHATVGVSLAASTDRLYIGLAAPVVDELRTGLGRAPDGDAEFAQRNAANMVWLHHGHRHARAATGERAGRQEGQASLVDPVNEPLDELLIV